MTEQRTKEDLYRLLERFLQGEIETRKFCGLFETIFNLELDYSTLSDKERLEFEKLFDEVVYYSPFPEERLECPNYRDEVAIRTAAERAWKALRGG